MATYVEPIARARAGALSAERVWADLVRGLPKGLPKAGDQGLDVTHTWGRTYWGGALFWFLADVQIREQTDNRRSLADALRGILAAGGDMGQRWDFAHTLEVGDHAIGVNVLKELHEKMGSNPGDVDLDALFARLGVEQREGKITFDDRAPLAAIRRSITAVDPRSNNGRKTL